MGDLRPSGAFFAKVRAASLDECCDMLREAHDRFHAIAAVKETVCWTGNAYCMSWATDHNRMPLDDIEGYAAEAQRLQGQMDALHEVVEVLRSAIMAKNEALIWKAKREGC